MTIARVLAVLAFLLPAHFAHAQGQVTPLDLRKMSIKLNFAKTGGDGLQLQAVIPVPDGFSVAGRMVTVNVGGVERTVALDLKGKGVSEGVQVKFTVKSQKGVVAAQDAKFSVKLAKGTFAAQLADEGLVDATVDDLPLSIGTDVTIDTVRFTTTVQVLYTAKTGKTGKAKQSL